MKLWRGMEVKSMGSTPSAPQLSSLDFRFVLLNPSGI